MLGVILTILKILGIILLVILGLLLLIVGIVLFVPIRYRSKGYVEKTDEGIDDKIFAKVTWLLHIVSVSFELDGKEPNLVVRIFGKRLNIGSTKTKDTKITSDKVVNGHSEASRSDVTKIQYSTGQQEKVVTQQIVEEKVVTEKAIIEKNVADGKANEETITEETEAEEKKSLKSKILDILEKIKNIFEKIKRINAIKNAFIEYLKRDESKIAIREIKKIIFGAIKHIFPQKFRASAWFGFEDPATTGNVLGALSIFYGIYGEKLDLNPNFEREVLKFEYELKGRIRIFTLIVAALRIYSNKWIKDFIIFSQETVKNV